MYPLCQCMQPASWNILSQDPMDFLLHHVFAIVDNIVCKEISQVHEQ